VLDASLAGADAAADADGMKPTHGSLWRWSFREGSVPLSLELVDDLEEDSRR
jgi:hypothetical protein